ncbi:MAG TPA: LytR C-terminal domain-containing protein [Acidimicrobiales bacterium]|nr:LytR C-terminal domain-containing protein [Acidimicrobiales bacterium]
MSDRDGVDEFPEPGAGDDPGPENEAGPQNEPLAAGPGGTGPTEGPRRPARPRRPAGGRPLVRTVQPWRAAAIVVVAVAVGIAVLARGGAGGRLNAALATKPTTTHHVVSTTSVPPATVTTVPTTTTTTLPPTSVKVLVLNGWTTAHGALYFQKKLQAAGYDTLAPNDATASNIKSSEVLYSAPKYQPNAAAIAASLSVPATGVIAETATDESAVPSALLPQAVVIVVIGEDISSQVPAGYSG